MDRSWQLVLDCMDRLSSANVSRPSTPWPTPAAGKAALATAGPARTLFDLRRVAVVHNLHVIARHLDDTDYQLAA